jgi:hypothetical protein
MKHRFLAFLLFGMVALVAWNGFEVRAARSVSQPGSATSVADGSGDHLPKAGGNPWPPPPK